MVLMHLVKYEVFCIALKKKERIFFFQFIIRNTTKIPNLFLKSTHLGLIQCQICVWFTHSQNRANPEIFLSHCGLQVFFFTAICIYISHRFLGLLPVMHYLWWNWSL